MYILGIDVGTTGTKSMVIDGSGRILSRGYASYELIISGPGRVEQDPRLWWSAVVQSVRQACAGIDTGEIAALSVSTQGASSVLVDAVGEPLGNAITWMDTRSEAETRELITLLGDDAVYRQTGWPLSSSLDLAKLLWLVRNEPEILAGASKFISTLEYINQALVGRQLIDPTNAAMRQLMSLQTLAWDDTLMAATGARPEVLPEIEPTGAFIGYLQKSAAESLGLTGKVRVFNGAHDQYCGCVGSDAVRPGEIMLSTGTAWVLMVVSRQAIFPTPVISPGPHIVPGLWGALAALPAGGSAFDWYKKGFLDEDYGSIEAHLGKNGHNRDGLFFYPHLTGEYFPRINPDARGTLVGLGLEHGKYDVAEAVMEGVVFQLRTALDEYRKAGYAVNALKVSGGALNSPYWTSLIVNNTACEVFAMSSKDAACLGAAAIAGVGVGLFPDYASAASRMNRGILLVRGDQAGQERQSEKYKRYLQGWKKLSGFYMEAPTW